MRIDKIFEAFKREKIPEKTFNVSPKQICNLSKIPLSIKDNFLYDLAEISKNHSNKKKAWSLSKKIFNNLQINIGKNLSEFYSISSPQLSKYPPETIFLPWLHYKPVEFRDVFFKIFFDEDYQFLQFHKIFGLVQSIKKHGYLPEKFPTRQKGISGYFLKKNNKRVFYICSGNHRIAVLSSLFPNKFIRVVLENKKFLKQRDIKGTILENQNIEHPEYFCSDEANKWPSVTSKFLSVEEASSIFLSYFNQGVSLE